MHEKIAVTLYLKKELINNARKYAKERGINVSGTVNLALDAYLKEEGTSK